MALVDDDEPVPGEQLVRLFPAGQALDHGNINHFTGGVLAAADDADAVVGDAEMFAESFPPLGEERLAVDQDQTQPPRRLLFSAYATGKGQQVIPTPPARGMVQRQRFGWATLGPTELYPRPSRAPTRPRPTRIPSAGDR